jgi:hypothetical protein
MSEPVGHKNINISLISVTYIYLIQEKGTDYNSKSNFEIERIRFVDCSVYRCISLLNVCPAGGLPSVHPSSEHL